MIVASSVAAWLALIWSAVLLWLAIGAVIRRTQLARRVRAGSPGDTRDRRVLLIRCCAGAEPRLRENLLSLDTMPTGARLRVIFTVDDHGDRAWPIAVGAAEQLRSRGHDVHVEVHAPTGPNRKASLLAAVLRGHASAHELIVNVDSNVDLDGFDLDALLGPLAGPVSEPGGSSRVGVAWAPWVELRGFAGIGPRASEAVLGGSLTSFPLLCGIHPNGLVGKIWAARADALADVGDFAELAHYLGEDLAMADRLRAAGWLIAVAPVLGHARGGAPSFAQVIERFGRWMLVVRGQEPRLLPTYPLFFFATPMIGVIALLGLPGRPELAAMAAVLAVSARLLITAAARYWSGRGLRPVPTLVDFALSDLVLLLAWVRAVSRREVEWRGHRLRVEPGGRLSAVD